MQETVCCGTVGIDWDFRRSLFIPKAIQRLSNAYLTLIQRPFMKNTLTKFYMIEYTPIHRRKSIYEIFCGNIPK